VFPEVYPTTGTANWPGRQYTNLFLIPQATPKLIAAAWPFCCQFESSQKVCFFEQFGLREPVLLWSSPGRPIGGEEGIVMSVRITNSEVDGVSVVELDGRIVLGEESNSLREQIKSLIAEGKKKIVLNMANIKYIDSAGLGTLVAAHLSAKNQGASVRLCHLGEKFHEVLQLTKLLTIFDVYDTQAAAVSSFQSHVAASN
jgi:anti-sigma B factor antagonist